MARPSPKAPWGIDPAVATSAYYNWTSPEGSVSVALHLSVVDRLEREIAQAHLGGRSMAGVLLGRSKSGERCTVTIEGFVTVDDGSGAATVDSNSGAFKEAIEKWLDVDSARRTKAVGIYRSQSGAKFALSDQDFDAFKTHFSRPDRVALVVRPCEGQPSAATLLVWEEGEIGASSNQPTFPFNRWELLQAARFVPATPTAPEPIPLLADEPPSQRTQTRVEDATIEAAEEWRTPEILDVEDRSGWIADVLSFPESGTDTETSFDAAPPQIAARSAWMPVAICAVLMLLAGAGLYVYQTLPRPEGREKPPAVQQESRIVVPKPSSLGLQVVKRGSGWELTWNADAPAVVAASRGHLLISDGVTPREVVLSANHLRLGRLVCSASGGDVSFRMEVVDSRNGQAIVQTIFARETTL